MIEIKDLLEKFSDIILSQEAKKESVRNVFSVVLGVQIKKEDIKIKNNDVYLNIKPIYKNEIFIKKDLMMDRLRGMRRALSIFSPGRRMMLAHFSILGFLLRLAVQ